MSVTLEKSDLNHFLGLTQNSQSGYSDGGGAEGRDWDQTIVRNFIHDDEELRLGVGNRRPHEVLNQDKG